MSIRYCYWGAVLLALLGLMVGLWQLQRSLDIPLNAMPMC